MLALEHAVNRPHGVEGDNECVSVCAVHDAGKSIFEESHHGRLAGRKPADLRGFEHSRCCDHTLADVHGATIGN
ncbi:MAG TPA: hypothetical protein VNM90_20505, partial [Haliangium sp.]|nr:hypothetical protein [Haliangium sp.]